MATIPKCLVKYPCKTILVSSFYGNRIHPITRKKSWHGGVDLASAGPLIAPFSYEVVKKSYNAAAGYNITIERQAPIKGQYVRMFACHLEERMKVNVGDKGSAGDTLATLGTTGSSTGVHLHFEIYLSKDRKKWTAVNPLPFLLQKGPQPITHTLSVKHNGYILEVLQLQMWLNDIFEDADLEEDGLFGTATLGTVRRFQRKYKLDDDGIVGPLTLKKLKACMK